MSHSDKRPRFFAPDLDGDSLVLPPGEAHHALHVLRLKAGADVELFDGRGRSATGRIVEARRDRVVVSVLSRAAARPRPEPAVHLAFAVPKAPRLDWLLEKATELGAASLRPVVFHRSVAGGGPSAAQRRRRLACCVAAAKQCGLNFLPDLHDPLALADYLKQVEAAAAIRLLGSADPRAPGPAETLARRGPNQDIHLLVGPEGGLTGEEHAAAVAAGFLPVRVGRTTLRVETAALALLTAAAICT